MIRTASLAMLLGALALPAARAQPHADPEPPEAVTIRFTSDGVELVGSLHLPEGRGRHPVVVLLQGSGPSPRDNHGFRAMAELFTSHGLATFAYDKRGVGDSGGEYVESPPFENPARDGLAAIEALRARPDVDPERIGVWGVSQGGWVGPLMASMSDDVAFVVSVSGPGVTPLEQSLYLRKMELIEEGWDPGDAAEVTRARRAMWRYWQTWEGRAGAEAALREAKTRPWFDRLDWSPTLARPDELPEGSRAWFRHAGYDPVPVAEALEVPVLHVFGAKDRHVPVAASVRALETAYARSGHPDATIRVFPDAGHAIQTVEGEAECLRCIREAHGAGEMPRLTFAPGYHELLIAWLTERLGL